MGILQINTDSAGQIGVNPRRVKIISSDNLATVTAAGYLNPISLESYVIYNTDIIDMWYDAVGNNISVSNPGTYNVFLPTISNGVITLTLYTSSGDVLLPVVSGDVPIFNGASGQIKDSGAAPSNTSDPFFSMSPGGFTPLNVPLVGDANGSIIDSGASRSNTTDPYFAMSIGSMTTGNLLVANDVRGSIGDSGIPRVNVIQNSNVSGTQNIQGRLTTNSVPLASCSVLTCTASQLALAGHVFIVTIPSLTSQIAILDVKVMLSAGLSGGGGDRLLLLTDGLNVFNSTGITAALLGTPVFTPWGGTGNPLTSAAETSVSQAGQAVYLVYTGGTTDYTAGSVRIAVTYVQVSA